MKRGIASRVAAERFEALSLRAADTHEAIRWLHQAAEARAEAGDLVRAESNMRNVAALADRAADEFSQQRTD